MERGVLPGLPHKNDGRVLGIGNGRSVPGWVPPRLEPIILADMSEFVGDRSSAEDVAAHHRRLHLPQLQGYPYDVHLDLFQVFGGPKASVVRLDLPVFHRQQKREYSLESVVDVLNRIGSPLHDKNIDLPDAAKQHFTNDHMVLGHYAYGDGVTFQRRFYHDPYATLEAMAENAMAYDTMVQTVYQERVEEIIRVHGARSLEERQWSEWRKRMVSYMIPIYGAEQVNVYRQLQKEGFHLLVPQDLSNRIKAA